MIFELFRESFPQIFVELLHLENTGRITRFICKDLIKFYLEANELIPVEQVQLAVTSPTMLSGKKVAIFVDIRKIHEKWSIFCLFIYKNAFMRSSSIVFGTFVFKSGSRNRLALVLCESESILKN